MSTAVVLFTRDLRVHYNPAFAAACAEADRVVPLFVFDDAVLATRVAAANKVAFLIDSVFLVRDLYVDWRAGARHFLSLLVDGDIANNQMNWQWVAGTGTHSRPNRVLRPLRQAERFDPDGDYVRRYVDELAGITTGAVHRPWELDDEVRADLDYPHPIVDHAEAVDRFRAARGLD